MSDYPRQLRYFCSYNVMCEAADHIELIEERLAEAEALLDFCVQNLECGEVHHEKHEYHKASDPCPVMARLHAFLGDKP